MKLERSKVAEILNNKKANLPCHRCGQNQFSVLDKFATIFLNPEISGDLVLGGPSVPVAIVVCDNCGAVTYHAIGALGLLPPQNTEGEPNGQ